MKIDDYPAVSDTTGKTYENWSALVEAESNGYMLIAIITSTRNGKAKRWPVAYGPYPNKHEATKAKGRLRTKWKREQREFAYRYGQQSYEFFIREAWKDPRDRMV